MIEWSYVGFKQKTLFKAGEKVTLVSTDYPEDHRCNGEFIVADALNARYKLRGDLFMPTRSLNILCHADIYKTT